MKSVAILVLVVWESSVRRCCVRKRHILFMYCGHYWYLCLQDSVAQFRGCLLLARLNLLASLLDELSESGSIVALMCKPQRSTRMARLNFHTDHLGVLFR